MMTFEHGNVGIKNLKKNVFDPSTILRYPTWNHSCILSFGITELAMLYFLLPWSKYVWPLFTVVITRSEITMIVELFTEAGRKFK